MPSNSNSVICYRKRESRCSLFLSAYTSEHVVDLIFIAIFAVVNGVLAQLVERLNGIQKVRSSILLCSTRGTRRLRVLFSLARGMSFPAIFIYLP